MILNWIKVFVHQLRQHKLFMVLNILGLSIGIGGIIFAILYWNEEHAYNAWNPEKDQVFQLVMDMGEDMRWGSTVAPLGPLLEKSPEVDKITYYNTFYYNEIIKYKGKKHLTEKIMDAQNTFFELFPFEFVKGQRATALPNKSSIALREDTARMLFGDEDPLNKTVDYSGRQLVVTGVYRIPGPSSVAPMAVTNLIDDKLKENINEWGNFNWGMSVKLKNPNAAPAVSRYIERIFYENRTLHWAKEAGMTPEKFVEKYGAVKAILEPLATVRLHSVTAGYAEGAGNYQFLLIMAGLSVLILVLSIVNYVNLATANAIKRAKEVGVRKILGAGKSNIISQFLFETAIMTVFSIVLALAIVELSLPFYNDFLSKDLVMSGSQFYLQLTVIFVTVMVLAGIFPAAYVSNFETLKVLKGNFGRSKSGVWLRNGMLILQFSIASFFIIGSYVVYKQVDFMNHKDLGFKGSQVLDVYFRFERGEENFDRYATIKQELLKIPGVTAVSAGGFAFGNGSNSSSGFSYKGGPNIQAKNMPIDYNMLDMMKIKVLQGRGLSPKIASDTINTILVNQTVVAMMGEKEPLGKQIEWNNNKLTIVGVVQDFHINGPQSKIPPMMICHYKTISWMEGNMDHIYVKANPAQMDQTIAQIEKFWTTKVDREYPFKYDFVDKTFARTFEAFVKQKNLFALLNVVVILIALFGLFALASYSIERRMKEIAIRKTLGAETGSLLRALSKQYVVFCIIGFAIALVPTWYVLQKWLENFAYRIDVTVTPFIIGFVVLSLLTIAIVTTRAWQATKADVLRFLKYE